MLPLYYQYKKTQPVDARPDGRYEVARVLGEYSDKGYTIATSEAGLLPLYSHWRAIDTWGLNDQWIAHNGGITTEYLERYKPEVIVTHPWHNGPLGEPFEEMATTVQNYAENNGYTAAGAFSWDGQYPEGHYYYVRNDFPESEEIIDSIRNINYPRGVAPLDDESVPEINYLHNDYVQHFQGQEGEDSSGPG
jgi:hypothetical protein